MHLYTLKFLIRFQFNLFMTLNFSLHSSYNFYKVPHITWSPLFGNFCSKTSPPLPIPVLYVQPTNLIFLSFLYTRHLFWIVSSPFWIYLFLNILSVLHSFWYNCNSCPFCSTFIPIYLKCCSLLIDMLVKLRLRQGRRYEHFTTPASRIFCGLKITFK